MVGRGGRSKACFSCRTRRIKCDEAKPKCLRCQNSRIECPGYPDVFHFIDNNPVDRPQSLAKSEPSTRPTQIKSQKVHPQEFLDILGDDVYFAFMQHEIQDGTSLLDDRWPGFFALPMPNSLAHQCLRSFAASFFGRRKGVERARKEGMQLYGKSLRQLNEILRTSERSSPSQTILAIVILTVCEYLVATSHTGWLQHMLGLTAYYESRGLDMFREPYALYAFQADRFSMITAAIASRRPTCLASEEWKNGPWKVAQAPKGQIQLMLDHATEIPGLYIDLISYLKERDTATKDSLGSILESNMKRILQDFRTWEREWRLQETTFVVEEPASEHEREKYGISTKLVFGDKDQVLLFITYNTVMIILLELWKTFRRVESAAVRKVRQAQFLEGGRTDNTDSAAPDTTLVSQPSFSSLALQARSAAMDICRTLPLYLTPSGDLTNGIQLLVPIRMALIVFRQGSRRTSDGGEAGEEYGSVQAAWLTECLSRLSQKQQGWEIGRYAMQGFGYV